MATGISSIGKRTIKNLIKEFSKNLPEKINLLDVAKKLLELIKPKYYEEEFKEAFQKPYLEIMLCGL